MDRAQGHVCEHVLDLGIAQAKDNALWARAQEAGAIIVSKDEDFAEMVRRSSEGRRPSVMWLRTGNGTTRDLLSLIAPIWPMIENRLAAGDRLIEVR